MKYVRGPLMPELQLEDGRDLLQHKNYVHGEGRRARVVECFNHQQADRSGLKPESQKPLVLP